MLTWREREEFRVLRFGVDSLGFGLWGFRVDQ